MRRLRFAKRIAMAAMLVALQVLSNAGAAQAQTITSFDGDKGPGRDVCKSATPPIHCDRAEMDVATNGKQVVQVTWQNVNVYDTTGKLLKSTPLAALIRTTGLDPDAKKDAGPFEPHIVFNEFIDRWIITVTCKSDCTLVSAGSDATGDWGGAYLSCLQGGECWARNPAVKIGYDRNGTYICGGRGGQENPATVPGVAYD